MNQIDLHIHSYHSLDGEFSEAELVNQAKSAGLKVMAVADHNSAQSAEKGMALAEKAGIVWIPAIEIDCDFQGTNVHLLGYRIDYRNPVFLKLTKQVEEMEREASGLRIEKTQALGLPVSRDDFPGKEIIIPEEIAEVLLARNDAATYPILRPYLPGGDRSDNPYVNFYWDYFAKDKPCYVPVFFMSLQEAVQLVKQTGGIPIVAHPEKTFGAIAPHLDELIAFGVEGLEVFSSYHSPGEIAGLYELAKSKDLLVTFGSDYHGKTKPSVCLGMTCCEMPNEDQLDEVVRLITQPV